WDGGCLVRWSPDGKVDRVVKMPCRRVTSCIFGGPDLDTLYITTVRYGLSDGDLAEQPLAGAIFALDPGVDGIPDRQFTGEAAPPSFPYAAPPGAVGILALLPGGPRLRLHLREDLVEAPAREMRQRGRLPRQAIAQAVSIPFALRTSQLP